MSKQRPASPLHILWAHGHYIGQVRAIGCRNWKTVTGRCRTAESALSLAAARMKGMKRARVIFIDDNPDYDGHVSMEAAHV